MSELTGGAGMPDSWSRLWAPHRMSYLDGENRPLPGNDVACPFCAVPSMSDEEGLVVFRGKEAYVVMNLYPYNAGHVLVCAYRHVADLTDLGMNQGAVSGAGVAAHIHQHVVPRWAGDANFMPIIGQTKVLPQLLQDTRSALAAGWNEIN